MSAQNPFFAPLELHVRKSDGSCFLSCGAPQGRYLAFNIECSEQQAAYIVGAANELTTLRQQLDDAHAENDRLAVEADRWMRDWETATDAAKAANDALHKCLAATGDDAGDRDDFRALSDRQILVVHEVKGLRERADRTEQANAALRAEVEEAKKQASLAWERHAEKDRAYGDALKQRDDFKAAAARLAGAVIELVNHPRMKSAPMAEVSDEFRERMLSLASNYSGNAPSVSPEHNKQAP